MSTVVKNMALYTSTFVKSVDFMLRLLTLTTHIHTGIKKQTNKGSEGNAGVVGRVYYLDCGDGIMCICIR